MTILVAIIGLVMYLSDRRSMDWIHFGFYFIPAVIIDAIILLLIFCV